MSANKNRSNTTVFLSCMGLLIAMEVLLERVVAINLLDFKLNFAFVPVAVAAFLFGPLGGALCYGLGDLIGSLLLPTGGYNPLFTLTAVLVGALYGFLFKGEPTFWRIALGALLARTVGTLLLNTLWISLFFSPKGFLPLMVFRLPEAGLMFMAEIAVLTPILCGAGPRLRKMMG